MAKAGWIGGVALMALAGAVPAQADSPRAAAKRPRGTPTCQVARQIDFAQVEPGGKLVANGRGLVSRAARSELRFIEVARPGTPQAVAIFELRSCAWPGDGPAEGRIVANVEIHPAARGVRDPRFSGGQLLIPGLEWVRQISILSATNTGKLPYDAASLPQPPPQPTPRVRPH